MPSKSEQLQPLFIDPNNEPIRAVDQITFHRRSSAHLDMTCCAQVPVARSPTEWGIENVVTARLRMDITMAKALAEGLTAQIAMLEAAISTKN